MKRLEPGVEDRRFVRRTVLLVFVAALVVFAVRASDLLLLVFGAALGAVLLGTVADAIAARTRLPRGAGLAVAALGLIAALGLMGWLFGAETVRQADALRRTLPRDWAQLQARAAADPLGHALLSSAADAARGSKAATLLLGAGWGLAEILVNFLIILAGAVFFAAQPQLYRRGLVGLVPPAYRPVAADAVADVARALRLWLLTQLVSMAVMGVLIGLGLWWSGIEGAAALGLLGGLSEFIPYVGPTFAMIPAIVVALAGSGSVWGVLGTYAVVRVVQANIITPLVSQQLVSVPPGLYLFLILAAGYAFGTFGLFFSGALSVTAYTLFLRLYARETLGDDVALPGEDRPAS